MARPRMVICVPSGVTEVERRAVKDSGERANAREVYLIEDGTFEPSYMPNVTLKLFDGDIAPDSEAQTAFDKYKERKNV